MNLHKRSCCSTWVPRKINMEFAKDSRKIRERELFIREEWLFPDQGILINYHIYIYAQLIHIAHPCWLVLYHIHIKVCI